MEIAKENWLERQLENDPEHRKLFHRECTKLACSEAILELMESQGISRKQLAKKMGIAKKKLDRKLDSDKIRINFLCDAFIAMGYMADIRARPFKLGEYRPRIEGVSPEKPENA